MEKIKLLREKTGAGMVECKKALDETSGDIDKAVEILRKKGSVKAAKKSDRATNEGLVDFVKTDDNKKVSVVNIKCETDFVARNEDFKEFVQEVAKQGLESDSKAYFDEKKDEVVLKVGENIIFESGDTVEGGFVGAYKHSNSKIVGIAVFDNAIDEGLASDIGMQIAAMSPTYLSPDDVPAEEVEKEKDIYREQLKKEGKPDEIIEKILMGKINKYYEEVCLLKQVFIKDDKKSIEGVIAEAGSDIKLVKFLRISL